MDDTLLKMCEKANYYKSLILQKEELLKEYESWNKLYLEVKELLDASKAAYDIKQTEEAKENYEKWVKDSEEYLAMVCEYSEKFEKINQELDTYDHETMGQQVDYFANLTKFEAITKELQKIQKASLKASDVLELQNAEGRKKRISRDLANDYISLVEEKKSLAKLIKKQHNPVINKVKAEEAIVETEEEQHFYEKLTVEEKIKFLEEKTKAYRLGPGIKKNIKVYDEQVIVPKPYIGAYLLCANELMTLKKHVLNPNISVISHHDKLFYDAIDFNVPEPQLELNEKSENIIEAYGKEYEALPIEEKIKRLEERLDLYKIADGEKVRLNCFGDIVYIPEEYKANYYICANELRNLKRKLIDPSVPLRQNRDLLLYSALTSEVPTLENELAMNIQEIQEQLKSEDEKKRKFENNTDQLIALVNENYEKHQEQLNFEKNKPKGFMKIKKTEKSRNKEELKRKLKKAGLIIAASVAILVSAGSLIGSLKNNKKQEAPKTPDKNITIESNSEQELEDVINDLNEEYGTQVKVDDSIISTPEVEENNVIRLGDEFFLNGEVQIYNNIYDATLDRNGQTPYFEQNAERTIGGLAINYEGQLHFFYSNDVNAQENVDMLLANGGKITAVLAENQNGYEGFYSISDIVVLSNTLGGNSR